MTGRTFKTVSQCYFGRCPNSRGTGKEEPPGALYPQGQIKLRLGRRQVWLRRTRLPRIPLLLHNTEETREADSVGLPRICELPRLVEPGKENNGPNASERADSRTSGVLARPWTVWRWPGTVVRRYVRVDRTQSRSRHNKRRTPWGLIFAVR